MEWYEAEVRELVARMAAEPIPDPIVVYGSSSIRLWTTLAHDLALDGTINAGFGGSTLEACAFFFERIVPPVEPAALLVYAGDNDLGDGRSPEAVLGSFRELAADVAQYCGAIPLGFMSIKPSPARFAIDDRIRRANELIRRELECVPNGFYIPLHDAMLLDGQPRRELFHDDGLHLNAAGYALWAHLLEPFHDQLTAARTDAVNARLLRTNSAPPPTSDEPAVS